MTTQPLLTQEGIQPAATLEQVYEHAQTRALVSLVEAAAELVQSKGEAAFTEFRVIDSRWRQGETYIFILDPEGDMLVHPDPGLEGTNQLALKDINGRPIIEGLIAATTAVPGRPVGWYHYQWPVPGELLPRWKSSYVRLVSAPSGKSYVVGCGIYNDRMERAFVTDLVAHAVAEIEQRGEKAFPLFHDPAGPFMVKDAYIFLIDLNGVELVNPAFPSLVGRNLMDLKDTAGKLPIREMVSLVQTSGAGWVDYMWPKPGESVSTQKSAYVSRARLDDRDVIVGCGVYLAEAVRQAPAFRKLTAPELVTLVREAAAVLAEQGEKAYVEFRKQGSKWFRDETYFFVWTMDGVRAFHATDPTGEGRDESTARDVLGRPYGRMFLEAGASPSGEGWVHYMYPEPGSVFPAWKSTFVKRVTFPSGRKYILGSGVYHLQMDRSLIESLVNDAVTLITKQGKEAFALLRDPTGPFRFMDIYVFVQTPEGAELVNPAQPALEGRNLIDLKDLRGKPAVRDEIEAAMKEGSAWLEHYWYRPGDNVPARKLTYVRKAQTADQTYIVGSGLYPE